ncbi:MAG: hypothetical protein Q8M83_02725 [bacterium]|nr:hypothetical protein [bacterium]
MTILQGLKLIDRAGLPHPKWEFVKTSKDLKNFFEIQDYVGWTIRTVEVKNGPWKNLYVNWLDKKQVPAKIDELQKQQKNKAVFVVYPSWRCKKSGTILIDKDRTVIEATKGVIVDLMRYGKVTVRYSYKNGKMAQADGNKDFLTSAQRGRILQAGKKLKKKGIILEWAISQRNEFIFYRIESVREAARLLLKKYCA